MRKKFGGGGWGGGVEGSGGTTQLGQLTETDQTDIPEKSCRAIKLGRGAGGKFFQSSCLLFTGGLGISLLA